LIIVIAFTTIFAPLLLKGYYHALGSRLAAEPVRRQ
jgi:hypothetical protein